MHERLEGILRQLERFKAARQSYIAWQASVMRMEQDLSDPVVHRQEERHRCHLDCILRGLRLMPFQVEGLYQRLRELKRTIEKHEESVLMATRHLPVQMASQRRVQCKMENVDIHDLVAEGTAEMQRVIRSFDYRCGYRFATYCGQFVCARIRETVHKQGNKAIKVPNSQRKMLEAVRRVVKEYIEEYQTEPTVEYVARAIGEITPGMSQRAKAKKIEAVNNLFQAVAPTVSLQDKVTYGEQEEIGNLVPDRDQQSPAQTTESTDIVDSLRKAWEQLAPSDRELIAYDGGVFGYPKLERVQLAQKYQCSESNIGMRLRAVTKRMERIMLRLYGKDMRVVGRRSWSQMPRM